LGSICWQLLLDYSEGGQQVVGGASEQTRRHPGIGRCEVAKVLWNEFLANVDRREESVQGKPR